MCIRDRNILTALFVLISIAYMMPIVVVLFNSFKSNASINTFYLNSNSRGMGQAKAVLFFILVAAIALIQLRATHSREVQQ